MTLFRPSEATSSEPYERLAELYDFVMRHVDYVSWADYVERVFRFFGPMPSRIVEVACGTGTLAIEMSRRGYRVHGIDRSEGMIDQARAKAAAFEGNAPTFAIGDMRSLPDDDADAVICLYDSVNYCLDHDDLRDAVAGFRRTVKGGSLCIFDVTTERNSVRYFRNHSYRERRGDVAYTRKSRYVAEERLQVNEFTFTRKNSDERVVEVHEQRIYSLGDVQASIPATQWDILGAFDDETFDPADESSERVHYVMRAR